jgi:hypothetical protein
MTQSKQTRDVNGNAMSYYKRIQNKESVMIVIAISNKRNNMFMINTTYNFHISLKLSLSLLDHFHLSIVLPQPCDRRQECLCDKTKTHLSEEIMVGKVIRCVHQLLKCKFLRPNHKI